MIIIVAKESILEHIKWLILLVIASYVVTQQFPEIPPGKPEKCHASPDLLYRQCCVFPPFFTRDVAKSCGAIAELTFVDKQNNVTGLRRRAITGCRHWACVLDKYDLFTEVRYVDLDKYFAHLDLWVELNPMFAEAMSSAKVSCKNSFRYFFPLKPCEFYDLHACIRNYINVICPAFLPTKECQDLKEFYANCKHYYIK